MRRVFLTPPPLCPAPLPASSLPSAYFVFLLTRLVFSPLSLKGNVVFQELAAVDENPSWSSFDTTLAVGDMLVGELGLHIIPR